MRPAWRARWCRIFTVSALFVAAGHLAVLAAEPTDPGSRLKAHLDAGEFGPALSIAQNANAGAARDAMLGQVAAAQAAVGLRSGALTTASQISSDLSRNEAIKSAATAVPRGNAGGAALADFDSLIDLITSTVAPTTWDEVGGPGSIAPFPGGVWVDAQGAMHRLLEEDQSPRLDRVYESSRRVSPPGSVRRTSPLRKVSLPRLERVVQLKLAAGKPLDEEMRYLAGLHKIQYVLIYPDSGDLVLAGPAGDWRRDSEGRVVSAESGRPVLQLDDLVVVLRHMQRPDATFGCSITPPAEALARTQAFVEQSSRAPLKAGGRDAWLSKLRATLGPQEIEYYGIDPRSRVAQVLVEADYRMKLVGIGLEEGVLGVSSYLSLLPKDGATPPLGVLRWWFTVKYDAIVTNAAREAYQLRGQGVQVLSENELLAANGQRVHTGESEPLNREFARSFTQHFGALAQKYPVYADLANLFDLAMVCALMESEHLAERVDWHQACFRDAEQYRVALGYAPRSVESVVNHRMLDKSRFVAAVSGGVQFEAGELVKPEALVEDKSGTLVSRHAGSAPENAPRDTWWWD